MSHLHMVVVDVTTTRPENFMGYKITDVQAFARIAPSLVNNASIAAYHLAILHLDINTDMSEVEGENENNASESSL